MSQFHECQEEKLREELDDCVHRVQDLENENEQLKNTLEKGSLAHEPRKCNSCERPFGYWCFTCRVAGLKRELEQKRKETADLRATLYEFVQHVWDQHGIRSDRLGDDLEDDDLEFERVPR